MKNLAMAYSVKRKRRSSAPMPAPELPQPKLNQEEAKGLEHDPEVAPVEREMPEEKFAHGGIAIAIRMKHAKGGMVEGAPVDEMGHEEDDFPQDDLGDSVESDNEPEPSDEDKRKARLSGILDKIRSRHMGK